MLDLYCIILGPSGLQTTDGTGIYIEALRTALIRGGVTTENLEVLSSFPVVLSVSTNTIHAAPH